MFHELNIIGNLGSDVEMRYMENGDAVASFSVASNRRWKTKSGADGEETVWFRVTVWRGLAETCNKYLSKGRQVFIKGRLTPDRETGSPRLWTDNSGNPRASFEVNASSVTFLGSAGEKSDPMVNTAVNLGGQKATTEVPF